MIKNFILSMKPYLSSNRSCAIIYALLIIISFQYYSYCQSANNKIQKTFNLVKKYYGDSCEVGISSSLIKKLYALKSDKSIKDYLKVYESIHQKITNFRNEYLNKINTEKGLLLDLDGIFRNRDQQNIVNACGIYFGADSVTNLSLSYIIVRNNINQFYLSILQLTNFDPIFRHEISSNGIDWFYSEKLKQIKSFSR